MRILVINGPNLNMLGKRSKRHYGMLTLELINELLKESARTLNVDLVFFQSNHEGDLIDFLQKETENPDGILINPGALTHYGYSLRDALEDTKLPIVEVHLSDIEQREYFRKIDVLEGIVIKTITGLKERGYILGLEKLVAHLKQKSGRK